MDMVHIIFEEKSATKLKTTPLSANTLSQAIYTTAEHL
jgi:hypothetical protein